MRIARIECRLHRTGFRHAAGAASTGGNLGLRGMETLLVRVETEDGLHGWGEGFGFSLARTTQDAVERLVAPACIGQDSRDIDGIGRMLRRRLHNYGRNGPVTFGISAIDIALWDIAGRRAGRPLHALLGRAARGRVPAYASLLRYGVAEDVARNAAEAVRRGYRAIKLHEIDPDCILAARRAAPGLPLMLDINCAWDDPEDAIRFCDSVAPLGIRWVEEPTWPPEALDGMARVRAAARCPIAAGENLGGVEDFRRLFAAGAVDVAQPSATKHGGVSALVAVAALARDAGCAVVPHSPYFGPGLLATLHVLAAAEAEQPIEVYFADLDHPPYGTALAVRDGCMDLPAGPGLGLEPS
ncbi:mandelate racemase/muconate lactonizing enzyme family protein [Falsiroseomonas sp. CW058]|uniref:mandelate racemase/muconate lactonizing enzyme family protein n=1 Tax=Falsiroseomonas sp. CW058 TaxID=3388664 RepID=UPI003D31F9F0